MTTTGFRFLSDEEFVRLAAKEKAMYLVRAQQELEERQRLIRIQMHRLAADIAPGLKGGDGS